MADYDNSAQGYSASGTSLNFSHTCAGTDRYMYLVVYSFEDTPTITATYNGVSMTQIYTSVFTASERVTVFEITAPATGTNTVAITATASAELFAHSVSYTGVDQTTPRRTHSNTASATSPISLTPTQVSGDTICTSIIGYNNDQTNGAGQTLRIDSSGGSNNGIAADIVSTGSTQTQFTFAGSATQAMVSFALIDVSVNHYPATKPRPTRLVRNGHL